MAIRSWNRFVTEGLAVLPEVMGRRHNFRFENAEIEIQLPSIEQVDRESKYDEVATVGSRWAKTDAPIEFRILKVDVVVRLGHRVSLPAGVLTVNANAFDLIPQQQQHRLEKLASEHAVVAEEAVEYWLSTLRWITDDYRIVRPYLASGGGDWGVRLYDDNTQKRVWVQSSTVHVAGYHRIAEGDWESANQRLVSGRRAPIHVSLKHDAEKFLALGDYRRSLIDLAISCETFLRNSVLEQLPSELNREVRDFIEQGNINQFSSRLLPSMLSPDAAQQYRRNFKPELASLFSKRNDIMHRGDSVAATAETCRRFLKLLNDLFALVAADSQSKETGAA